MKIEMLARFRRVKPLFIIAGIGAASGFFSAAYYGHTKPAEPPVFQPAPNPFSRGIYANGIVESYQTNGENINIYPEVGGTVRKILVTEGESVDAGTPILELDDSVQRATAEQQKSQAEAALAVLDELKAQPRKEVLDVATAQVDSAKATLKNVEDQLAKIKTSYRLNARSISKNDLDNAKNAVSVAKKQLDVATRQYELTKAGAWTYDIQNQEKQYTALSKQAEASAALLEKYTIKAPTDGVIMSIKTAVGSYVSPQGVYGTYTGGFTPVVVMGGSEQFLQVRTYVDEILIQKLPPREKLSGVMTIRGTEKNIPLEFVRMQPYVTPKIQLSDQRLERVDVRVLPLIFKFEKPKDANIYPGQLVDVYVGENVAQLPGTIPAASPSPSPSETRR